MNEAVDNPIKVSAPQSPRELGDWRDIGKLGKGGIQPAGKKGYIEVIVYNGFVKKNRQKDQTKRRVPEGRDAQEFINSDLIPELNSIWDKRAKELGRTREIPKESVSTNPSTEMQTLEEVILKMLTFWEERDMCGESTYRGYKYASLSFIKHSRALATTPGYVYTADDLPAIIAAMLNDCDKDTGGPGQVLRNLRYVLTRVEQFPAELIDKIQPEKGNAKIKKGKKNDFPFTPSERAIIWKNLPLYPDATTRGLILLLMNSSQHIVDVANLELRQLEKACEDVCIDQRWKTDVQFRMVMWFETGNWIKEMNFHKDDIYAFKEAVFSAAELKDPNINRVRLVEKPKEAAKRRAAAAAKAGKLVVKFLKFCKIYRPGLSAHSFRHSNVSEWEGQGFPRVVGMSASGHLTLESYMNYASALYEQVKNLSQATHSFWKHAGKDRLYICTKLQLYEALVSVIHTENAKLIAEMHRLHDAELAAVKNAKDELVAENQRQHLVVVEKLNQALGMLSSQGLPTGKLSVVPNADAIPAACEDELTVPEQAAA